MTPLPNNGWGVSTLRPIWRSSGTQTRTPKASELMTVGHLWQTKAEQQRGDFRIQMW